MRETLQAVKAFSPKIASVESPLPRSQYKEAVGLAREREIRIRGLSLHPDVHILCTDKSSRSGYTARVSTAKHTSPSRSLHLCLAPRSTSSLDS